MSDASTTIAPDALFVVACPVCQGQVAAFGSLCGHDACCPMCASLFHVPQPGTAAATPTASPSQSAAASRDEEAAKPSGLAEDWGGVITQLAPPKKDPEPQAPAPDEPADFELPALIDPAAAAAGPPPAAPSTIDLNATEALVTEPSGTSALVTEGSSTELPATAVMTADYAGPSGLHTSLGDGAAEVVEVTEATPPLRPPPRREGPQPAVADQLPVAGAPPLDPKASELVFSEPVRTIRSGNAVIEIRRLTPEERHARRVRRNILMIVIGFSILLMVVILLGVGGRR